MTVKKIERLFYKEIPGSIVHVLEAEKRCFQVTALFEAKSRKDAHQRAMSFLAASDMDFLAVSLIWHGSDFVCAFDARAPKPLTWEEQFQRDLDRCFSSSESDDWSDDDWDDDRSPNWPSTTGNPSGGGRDNNPPRR